MGDKTLGDCVTDDSLNGQIFVSSKPVSGDRNPTRYMVDTVDEKNLSVFPVDYNNGKPVVRKESVGLFYRQHKGDLVLG